MRPDRTLRATCLSISLEHVALWCYEERIHDKLRYVRSLDHCFSQGSAMRGVMPGVRCLILCHVLCLVSKSSPLRSLSSRYFRSPLSRSDYFICTKYLPTNLKYEVLRSSIVDPARERTTRSKKVRSTWIPRYRVYRTDSKSLMPSRGTKYQIISGSCGLWSIDAGTR